MKTKTVGKPRFERVSPRIFDSAPRSSGLHPSGCASLRLKSCALLHTRLREIASPRHVPRFYSVVTPIHPMKNMGQNHYIHLTYHQPYQRLAHPRRGGEPEFKLERYPPLDGASCWASFLSIASAKLVHPIIRRYSMVKKIVV